MIFEEKQKTQPIERREVWEAFKAVRAGGESPGVDGKGTPQGGVISPLLANIFLHFAFDMWFRKHYPEGKFERYADDSAPRSCTKDESLASQNRCSGIGFKPP